MGKWIYETGCLGQNYQPISMSARIAIAAGLSVLFSIAHVAACDIETTDCGPWTFNSYFENDLFGETDQHYTNGVRFSLISPDLDEGFVDDSALPGWIQRYNDWVSFVHGLNPNLNREDELQRNLVVSFGQLMFTPTDIDAVDIVENDRPYAGYLYLGMGYHTRDNKQLDTIEFNLGIVGPWSQADETQDFVHDIRGIEKFQGWHNQLENELGIQAVYEHKHRVLEKRFFSGAVEQDLIWHAGFSLGNVATYLNAGAEYRIGLSLPKDFGTSSLRTGGDSSTPGLGDTRLNRDGGFDNFHLFAGFGSRLVGRDIFLDGNTFDDSHHVDKKYFVYDLAAGFSFTYHRWKFSYAQIFRSKEFKTQDDTHAFGSLSVSYTW